MIKFIFSVEIFLFPISKEGQARNTIFLTSGLMSDPQWHLVVRVYHL